MKPDSLVGLNVIEELCGMAWLTPPGCFVEIGVYKGGTAWHLNEVAKDQRRLLFLFDTFTGIPYRNVSAGDPCLPGDFGDTSEELVRQAVPEAIITKGIFPASAENISIPPVAFVHLDCDQYQSYLESITFLSPLMVKGGVMWFDDYVLPGAQKAVDSLLGGRVQTAACGKHYVRF